MSNFFLVCLLCAVNVGTTIHHKSTQRYPTTTEASNMHDILPFPDDIDSLSTNETQDYTNWSFWSRCTECIQRRTKHCISRHCYGSTMYEERPCNKKRCKRKAKQKDKFHIVHLNESSSYLTKQAPSDIWSRWSQWSPCSSTCRTYRFRRCKKPGRCNKQTQKEEAYCYHDRTNCEEYVLNLMGSNNGNTDQRRYEYNNNNEGVVRQPRKRGKGRKKCGVPNRRTKMLKIIGGAEAQKYKWPWHVAIINQYMEVFCGGTLIASRWVLTANHCIRRYLRVRLNAHDLRSRDGRDVEVTVSKMFPHPKFNFRTVDNDIALLMLPKAVRTPVACLPNKRPRPSEMCSVMGWGKLHPMDVYGTNLLQEAKLPIVHPETCRKSYRRFLISDNMLCAGWASGRADTCAGDSGGGLICPSKRYRRNVYSVQGITSFGDGCGRRNKYGIYTTVYNYVGWINYIITHY